MSQIDLFASPAPAPRRARRVPVVVPEPASPADPAPGDAPEASVAVAAPASPEAPEGDLALSPRQCPECLGEKTAALSVTSERNPDGTFGMFFLVSRRECLECGHKWERRTRRSDVCDHGRLRRVPCVDCGRTWEDVDAARGSRP